MAKKSTKSSASKTAAQTNAAAGTSAEAGVGTDTEAGSLPINEVFNVYDHPIDDLKPRNIRTVKPEYIESLAKSIKVNGLRYPINIGTDGVVIDGDCRLAACKLLGLKTIPVIYATDSKTSKHLESTDPRAFAQTLITNLQRANMTPIETGNIFAQALADKVAPDAKSLAQMLGLSTAYVSRYMSLAQRGIPALQEKLAAGLITVEAANAIIGRAKSEGDQAAMLENLLKASDGKITIEHVNAAVPAGAQQSEEEVSFTAKKRGRPAGSAATRLTLPGGCMPESGNVSAQLAKSASGDWAVQVTVTIAHKGKTFNGFDIAKKAQAEIATIDSAAVRKELQAASERLEGN